MDKGVCCSGRNDKASNSAVRIWEEVLLSSGTVTDGYGKSWAFVMTESPWFCEPKTKDPWYTPGPKNDIWGKTMYIKIL